MKLQELKQTIPFKWKVQSFVSQETKGLCVGYIDSRNVMDLLDKVCGAENWQKKYYTVKNTLVCSIGIKTGEDWVWKDDGGTESFTDKEKGECSDAFKRAGVCWGIGRFLYDLDFKYVDIKNKKPVDIYGKRIYDLTKHFANTIADSTKIPNGDYTEEKPFKKEPPKEPYNEPKPLKPKQAITVKDAIYKKDGSIFNVMCQIHDTEERQTSKQKKDVTDYYVSDVDSEKKIIVTMWGKTQEGLQQKDVVIFRDVKVATYKGQLTYLAKSVSKVT